ncbi:hypothetical protein GCM10010442_73050 [Kitasatospora kifunensis]
MAFLPNSPLTIGIGEAEPTGAGTLGEALVGATDGPLFAVVPLLQAASTSIGRSTSNPALRRTVVLTVGHIIYGSADSTTLGRQSCHRGKAGRRHAAGR